MQRSSLTLCSDYEILVEGERSQTIPIMELEISEKIIK